MKKIILALLIVGCQQHAADEKLRLQAIETHESAIKISEQVREKINLLTAYAADSSKLLVDSLASLSSDFEAWEKSLVEVPGHEGHDHHHHDHDEHAHEVSSLTPEMMVDVQKDLESQIVRLNFRAHDMLNSLEKERNNESTEEAEEAAGNGT